jgi:hypothetical protein
MGATGRESWVRGLRAQCHATAFLLKFFSNVALPTPDDGVDQFGVLVTPARSDVTFVIQTKSGTSPSVRISAKTLQNWLSNIDERPALLLHVDPQLTTQEYKFLVLFDWMIKRYKRIPRILERKSVAFNLSDFTVVDSAGDSFLQAISAERDRVHKCGPFAANPDVPFSTYDMVRKIGSTTTLELPQAVRLEIARRPIASRPHFLRDEWHQAEISIRRAGTTQLDHWIAELLEVASPSQTEMEQRQFAEFIRQYEAMLSGQMYRLPRFNWDSVSSRRVWLEALPNTFRMLELFSDYPERWNRDPLGIAGATLLLSAAANSDALADRAENALLRLMTVFDGKEAKSRWQYLILREFHFARVEADIGKHPTRDFLAFIDRHRQYGQMEVWLHQLYYQTIDPNDLLGSLERKLVQPKPRDHRTLDVTNALKSYYVDVGELTGEIFLR